MTDPRNAAPSGPTLTDEDIEDIACEHGLETFSFEPYARAIESAVLARVAAAPMGEQGDWFPRAMQLADAYFLADHGEAEREALIEHLRAAAPAVQPPSPLSVRKPLTTAEIMHLRKVCRDDPRCADEHWFVLMVREVEAFHGISASGGTPEGERAAETQSGEVQR